MHKINGRFILAKRRSAGHPVSRLTKGLLYLAVLLMTTQANLLAREKHSSQKPLVFGVLPFMSPITLFKRYSPLMDYLHTSVKRTFIFETANNFPQHRLKTRRRQYDFVLTAPHFVQAAVNSGHYRIVATYSKPLSAIIVVSSKSKITTLAGLKNKTVSTPSPAAIVTIVGKEFLVKEHALRHTRFIAYHNHNAAYHAMLAGEASAAIISPYVLADAIRKGHPLRELARSRSFPSVGILAATDLPDVLVDKFVTALTTMHLNPKGRRALQKMAYPGYRKATLSDYKNLPQAPPIRLPAVKAR